MMYDPTVPMPIYIAYIIMYPKYIKKKKNNKMIEKIPKTKFARYESHGNF